MNKTQLVPPPAFNNRKNMLAGPKFHCLWSPPISGAAQQVGCNCKWFMYCRLKWSWWWYYSKNRHSTLPGLWFDMILRLMMKLGSIHPFIRSFFRSVVQLFVHSFIHSFVRSFVHSFVWLFIRSFVRSFIHSFIKLSFVRSFLHSFVHFMSFHFLSFPFISFHFIPFHSIGPSIHLINASNLVLWIKTMHVCIHWDTKYIYIYTYCIFDLICTYHIHCKLNSSTKLIQECLVIQFSKVAPLAFWLGYV